MNSFFVDKFEEFTILKNVRKNWRNSSVITQLNKKRLKIGNWIEREREKKNNT